MKVTETSLPGVLLIDPKLFPDQRGFFLESWNRARYQSAGIKSDFVQDNHSRSTRGILRGLHYQVRKPQAKLVWALQGEIYDVAVDVRPGSPHYGRWFGVMLNSETKQQIYVPAGFAHGFCVVSETAEVAYKADDYYDPGGEGGIIWNDPRIGIEWPISTPILSSKDAVLPQLVDALKIEV